MEEFLKRIPSWLFGCAAFFFVVMLAYSNFVSKEPFQIWGQPFGAIEKTGAAESSAAGLEWPSGAVMMFSESHSDDPTEPCPLEWSLLQEAAGRMPIGAGQPANGKLAAEFRKEYGQYERLDPETGELIKVDLRPYQQIDFEWQYYRGMEVGGSEQVALAKAQMPKHRHKISTNNSQGKNAIHDGLGGSNWHGGILESYKDIPSKQGWKTVLPHVLEPVGGTKELVEGSSLPHNNMPPYIALYFCKKD